MYFSSCGLQIRASHLVSCSDNKNAPFQVVDLLNQAALISTDEKLTVLKQVCSLFKSVCTVVIPLIWALF